MNNPIKQGDIFVSGIALGFLTGCTLCIILHYLYPR